MKKVFIKLAAISIICACILGCESDNDTVVDNHFLIDDVDYKLSNGYIVNYGASEGGYAFGIGFVSDGIEFNISDNVLNLEGTGNLIGFYLLSSTPNEFSEASYTLTDNAANMGDMEEGFYSLGWSDQDYLANIFTDMKSGGVTIKKIGGQYEVNINFIDSDNNKVIGYYKGELTYMDESN